MKKFNIILTVYIFSLTSCQNNEEKKSVTENVPTHYSNFTFVDDFFKSKPLFRTDTFDLKELSTEGGELIVYHTSQKNFIVLDIKLFGEMGRLNALYWTDKKIKPKIIKWTDFTYDKPMYEKGFKTKQTAEYYSFQDNKFIRYTGDRVLVSDSTDNTKQQAAVDLLKEILKKIEIVK